MSLEVPYSYKNQSCLLSSRHLYAKPSRPFRLPKAIMIYYYVGMYHRDTSIDLMCCLWWTRCTLGWKSHVPCFSCSLPLFAFSRLPSPPQNLPALLIPCQCNKYRLSYYAALSFCCLSAVGPHCSWPPAWLRWTGFLPLPTFECLRSSSCPLSKTIPLWSICYL